VGLIFIIFLRGALVDLCRRWLDANAPYNDL